MKVDTAIKEVQDAESDLAKQFRVIGERHAVEHDLYHLGHTLSRQCAEHLDHLAPFAERYGAPRVDADAQSPPMLEALRHKSAEMIGRSEMSGMLLLRDLRNLYLVAQHVEIAWVVCMQAAHAARDRELLQTAKFCHGQTEAQAKWLRTRIKQASPQILATG